MSRTAKFIFAIATALVVGLVLPQSASANTAQHIDASKYSPSVVARATIFVNGIKSAPERIDGAEDGTRAPLSLTPKVVRVVTTAAQPNEGVIRIVTRVCGNADNWQSIAADNSVTPPVYLVLLGQEVQVNCSSVTPAAAAPPAPEPAAAPAAVPVSYGWTHPLPGACVGSGFRTAQRPGHDGDDLAAGFGTPIHAAAAGSVSVGWQAGGAGNYTMIDHGGGVWTVYMHQSSFQVTSGWVNAGDVIGYVGSTGNSSGPHLHYEVHTGGLWSGKVDPMGWMSDHGVGMWC